MDAKIDPYADWLGITASERPVNHYDLLGLARFESDPARINELALQRSAIVKRYQLGIHSQLSQRLLNEISAARICLIDADKRRAYDESLRRREEPLEASVDDIPVAQLVSAAPLPLAAAVPLQPAAQPWPEQQEPNLLSGPVLVAVVAIPVVVLLGLGTLIAASAWRSSGPTHGLAPPPIVAKVETKPTIRVGPQPPIDTSAPVDSPAPIDARADKPVKLHPAGPRIHNPGNGHDYQRIEKTMSWHEASDYCDSLGGYLATSTSDAENQFLFQNFAQDHVIWLGATDEDEEGKWTWVTGEPWNYTSWQPGEPSNHRGKEHCLAMGTSLGVVFNGVRYFYRFGPKWNDHEASGDYLGTLICYPVCEWDKSEEKPMIPAAAAPVAPVVDPLAGTRAGEEREFSAMAMKFRWCPPGKFLMGSPDTDKDASVGEKPQREEVLSQGFWIQQNEMTQGVWSWLMKTEPWKGKVGIGEGPAFPASCISWNDAQEFCETLTALERVDNRIPADWEYRLPSEAEWEYACRAGTTTRFACGDTPDRLGAYAWFGENTSGLNQLYPHMVAKKSANAWGIFDMHGNVQEWCREADSAKRNPAIPANLQERISRGGSWPEYAHRCRSAARAYTKADPELRTTANGFRIVLSRVEKK